jgi:hypothetical protein
VGTPSAGGAAGMRVVSPSSGVVARWPLRPGLVIMLATLLALALRLFPLSRPGYLSGDTQYDDGVYFGNALRLGLGWCLLRLRRRDQDLGLRPGAARGFDRWHRTGAARPGLVRRRVRGWPGRALPAVPGAGAERVRAGPLCLARDGQPRTDPVDARALRILQQSLQAHRARQYSSRQQERPEGRTVHPKAGIPSRREAPHDSSPHSRPA